MQVMRSLLLTEENRLVNSFTDCIKRAPEFDFKILQFNAVVASNKAALHLYKKLGFIQLGIIPKGFLLKDGTYEDIIPHYLTLIHS